MIKDPVKQAKAQHFIPVTHLARFSASPITVPIRDRVVHLYDKRSASFRRAKVAKVAFENGLYTTRNPHILGLEPEPGQLIRAVFDPSNKDAEIERLKAEIEDSGVTAMRAIDAWDVGLREVSEEDRRPPLAYVGLLLAQHPAMMSARAGAIGGRFWTAAAQRGTPPPAVQTVWDEMARCMSVIEVVSDGFAAAFELNYLAWKVIRWPERPDLILGDVGVSACYALEPLGIGDLWAEDAKFIANSMGNYTDDATAFLYINGQFRRWGSSFMYLPVNDKASLPAFEARITQESDYWVEPLYVRVDVSSIYYAWHQTKQAYHATVSVGYSGYGSATKIGDPYTDPQHTNGCAVVNGYPGYSSTYDYGCVYLGFSSSNYWHAMTGLVNGESPEYY